MQQGKFLEKLWGNKVVKNSTNNQTDFFNIPCYAYGTEHTTRKRNDSWSPETKNS